MAALTLAQAGAFASAAGFSGESLATIVAIAQAESSLVTNARNTNTDGSIDRGILQINNYWHSEYSDAQCDDPATAFRAGWLISTHGTDFSQWTTFKTSAYKNTQAWTQWITWINPLPEGKNGDPAKFSFGSGTTTTQPPVPQPLAWNLSLATKVWPWLISVTGPVLTSPPINPYHSNFEASRGGVQDGIGIPVTPFGTPITSLTRGTVMIAAFGTDFNPDWQYGGFVIVRSTIPGIGMADVFYRHLDTISVKKGDSVKVGSYLGTSGGQNVGGAHPESQTFSTGPHIDAGLNPITLPYKAIGQNIDPTPWMQNLITFGPPASDKADILVGGTPLGNVASGIGNYLTAIEQAAQGTGPAANSFLAVELNLNQTMFMFPIRFDSSQQLSNPVRDWPFVGGAITAIEAPWNGAVDVASWLSGIADWLTNNITAMFVRFFFVLAGLLIITAFIYAMYRSVTSVAPIGGAQNENT